jgi:DNA invertase Pin-like site-specific DNA recombinase
MTNKRVKKKPTQKKVIGYLRASTDNQDLEKIKSDILVYAKNQKLGDVEFVEEVVSVKKPWHKRKIKDVLDTLDKDDWLIVSELSRLGRSTLEIMEIIIEARRKDINIHAIKNNWTLNGGIENKSLLMAFSMASEIERDFIIARTTEAQRARKASGVKQGGPKGKRKSKLDQYKDEIFTLIRDGVPKAQIARKYGIAAPNLYYWISINKEEFTVSSKEL